MPDKQHFYVHIEYNENHEVTVCELVKDYEALRQYQRVTGLADDKYVVDIGSDSIHFENMDYFYAGIAVGKAIAEQESNQP